MDLEDLELFGKPPLEKWKEVILNASPTLVGAELERIIELLSIIELFLEQKGMDSKELEYFICSLNEEQKEHLHAMKESLAIESMGKILGNYE
ncbi:DUF2018 family protein [Helicobacter himalayensis]|uniref:DUF2018 family protein n=1 Tax=Helicobacter himalayensis TaxID=1591088 RepID=UPI00082E8F2A|nr:DUF2018 family protein [Helicobacter himalayensis]